MTTLTFLIVLPLLAALVTAAIPRNYRLLFRVVNLATTFLCLIGSLRMFLGFRSDVSGFQFEEWIPWVDSLGIGYHVGVDGINIGLILLTGIVSFAAACVSGHVTEREKEYSVLFLLIVAGCFGAFASLDLFFLYAFHELALVPTFILIGVWGQGEDRTYAAYKMTLYLSLGALIALIGLIALYLALGAWTFDIPTMTQRVGVEALPAVTQKYIFPWLLFGFGILVSLWPFHTWAPRGYAAAPPAAAMLHAGVLKKFGLYALIRVALPLLPAGAQSWAHVLAVLAIGNLLYAGLVAMRQKDLNLLAGNSSVAHMGFAFLGIASLGTIGITGTVVVMVAHGLLAALVFGLNGWLRQQTGTLNMDHLGGLLKRLPFFGAVLVMAMMAGCGLPGFANFPGELLVLIGSWKTYPTMVGLAAWAGLIIGAVYMLRAIRHVAHGPLLERWSGLTDLSNPWRKLPFMLLLAALIIFGCFPRFLTDKIRPVAAEIARAAAGQSARPGMPVMAGKPATLPGSLTLVIHE